MGSVLQSRWGHPTKLRYQLNCRGWTTSFNLGKCELDLQSAEQRKGGFVPLSSFTTTPSDQKCALSWHRLAYLRVCRNIKVYHHIYMWDVQTSACNISSQQNRTCLCLELVQRAQAFILEERRPKGNERVMLILVNTLLFKYWYRRTGGETTQKLHFSNFFLNYYRIKGSIHFS